MVRKKTRNTTLCVFLDQRETEMISKIHPIAFAALMTIAIMFAAFLNASPALTQHGAAPPPVPTDTPEQKMQKRFPQPVRVGDLIGLPVLDDDDSTIGRVRQVVRTPEGKIKLIVSYGGWLGFGARPSRCRSRWLQFLPDKLIRLICRRVNTLRHRRGRTEAKCWRMTR